MLSREDEKFLLSQIRYIGDKPEYYIARVFYPNGLKHSMAFKTKDMAIYMCSGRNSAELIEVLEIAAGQPDETKLADIVLNDWYILDKTKLSMKEVRGAIARNGRSLTVSLIGEEDPPPISKKKLLKNKRRKKQ